MSSLTLVFLKHAPTTHVHARVHTAHGFLWAHDLNQEHWFLKGWLSHHLRSEARTTCWRHDLSCTAMNGVRMQGDIREVEANAAHVLLTDRALFRTPLESTVHVLLNFRKVLNRNCRIDDDI